MLFFCWHFQLCLLCWYTTETGPWQEDGDNERKLEKMVIRKYEKTQYFHLFSSDWLAEFNLKCVLSLFLVPAKENGRNVRDVNVNTMSTTNHHPNYIFSLLFYLRVAIFFLLLIFNQSALFNFLLFNITIDHGSFPVTF